MPDLLLRERRFAVMIEREAGGAEHELRRSFEHPERRAQRVEDDLQGQQADPRDLLRTLDVPPLVNGSLRLSVPVAPSVRAPW